MFVKETLKWEDQKGKLGTCTVNKIKQVLVQKGKLSKKGKSMSRRQFSSRLQEAGVVACRGWNKKVYSDDEKRARMRFCTKYRSKPKSFWRNIVFVDEHHVAHTSADNRDGYLASKRDHVYKRKGTPLDDRHCIPKNKQLKKYLTFPKNATEALESKYCVGILDDKVIVAKSCEEYVKFGGPPPKRPPQPLSKHGKKLGRKRKAENEDTTEKKGSFCSRHYGQFLHEIADAARAARGWGPKHEVWVYQDNLRLHFSDPALHCATAAHIRFLGYEDDVEVTDSPDLNAIERVFNDGDQWLLQEEVKKPAIERAVTNRRFELYCRKHARTVRAHVDRTPTQIEKIIAVKGGPARG